MSDISSISGASAQIASQPKSLSVQQTQKVDTGPEPTGTGAKQSPSAQRVESVPAGQTGRLVDIRV